MAIVGSLNYPGAAVLSCAAAGRVGAGLVTGAVAQPIWSALAPSLPEVTWLLLPHELGAVSEGAVGPLNEKLDGYDALLLGCGLGREETTRRFVERFLGRTKRPRASLQRVFGSEVDDQADDRAADENGGIGMPFGPQRRESRAHSALASIPPLVVDADGLNLLAEIEDWQRLLPPSCILTPHPAEMGRLCGMETQEVIQKRWDLAREKAAQWGAIVLLKGPYTVIAHPDERLAVLPIATPALATAGTGDVLAGIITGLLAQGLDPFDAACAGAWIHGRAGQYCEEEIGRAGVVAGDLLSYLPVVLSELQR